MYSRRFFFFLLFLSFAFRPPRRTRRFFGPLTSAPVSRSGRRSCPEQSRPGRQDFPNSSAARSELAVGDILLALNGTPVRSVDAFLAGLKSFKSGDHLIYRVHRGGNEMDVAVTLGEFPREQPDDIQVLYDAVDTNDARVRSIVTIPTGSTRKLPSILFVEGVGLLSGRLALARTEPHPRTHLPADPGRVCRDAKRKERSRRQHRHAMSRR